MNEYIKEFSEWNELKIILDSKSSDKFVVHESSVWLMSVGVNVGSEIDGKGAAFCRPVLILKKISKDVFFGVPISTKLHENIYRYTFLFLEGKSVAVLSQLRSFDKKRCIRYIGKISEKELSNIKKRLMYIFLQNETPPGGGESRLP